MREQVGKTAKLSTKVADFMQSSSFFSSCNRLIVIRFVVFSIIPMVTRNIIPYDMIENLYWGKELQLGYAKHPPLFAWVSYFFYKILASCPESLYILTQLNLFLGFYFIFKISELVFDDKVKSYSSVLIFMASVSSVFGNEKFNATTILMSLLPGMYYFFIRTIKFNTITDAVILGIFAALAFVGKYFALLFIGNMWLFLVFNKECWRLFKSFPIYCAVIIFLVCISWHVVWMYENDFITLKYAVDKSIGSLQNKFSAFNFLLMQCIFFATSFLSFFYSCSGKIKIFPSKDSLIKIDEKFIVFITVVPNTILFLISLITDMRIGSFWGTNMLMAIGIYLLILNKNFNHNRLFVFVKKISIFFAIVLFIKLVVARCLLKRYDPTNAIEVRKISQQIDKDWMSKFGHQKMEILKTDKATAIFHVYLKDSPSSYDIKHCNLFHVYDTYPQNKNVVITFLHNRHNNDIDRFRKIFNCNILFENTIHVIDDFFVYYAFVNVACSNEKSRN